MAGWAVGPIRRSMPTMTVRQGEVRTVEGGDRTVVEAAMSRVVGFGAAAMVAALAMLFWPTSLGGSTTLVDDGGDIVVVREADPAIGDVIAYSVPGGGRAMATVSDERLDGRLAVALGDEGASMTLPADADVLGVAQWRIPGAADWLVVLSSPVVLLVLAAAVLALLVVWTLHHDGGSPRQQLQSARARAAAARRPIDVAGRPGSVIHRH